MKRQSILLSLALVVSAGAYADLPGLHSPAGAVYRVVTPAPKEVINRYPIKPADMGDPLPEKTVRISMAKPLSFGDAVKLALADTDISVVFVGDDAIAGRSVAGVKLSGQLKGILDTLAQAGNVQYIFRDGVVRFVSARPYVLGYPDMTETEDLAGLIRRDGGIVLAEQPQRREVIFTADYAAMKRIQGDLLGVQALKRDPTQTVATRAVIAPDKSPAALAAAAALSAPLAPPAIVQPIVQVVEGKATIRWKGEVTELIRQIAAAAGATYAGTEGKPKAVFIDVTIADKPLMTALESIGNAMGDQADLVVKGQKYSVVFR